MNPDNWIDTKELPERDVMGLLGLLPNRAGMEDWSKGLNVFAAPQLSTDNLNSNNGIEGNYHTSSYDDDWSLLSSGSPHLSIAPSIKTSISSGRHSVIESQAAHLPTGTNDISIEHSIPAQPLVSINNGSVNVSTPPTPLTFNNDTPAKGSSPTNALMGGNSKAFDKTQSFNSPAKQSPSANTSTTGNNHIVNHASSLKVDNVATPIQNASSFSQIIPRRHEIVGDSLPQFDGTLFEPMNLMGRDDLDAFLDPGDFFDGALQETRDLLGLDSDSSIYVDEDKVPKKLVGHFDVDEEVEIKLESP